MRKLILIVFTALSFFNCSSLKKYQEKDNSVEKTVTERKEITRPGDTITINIPNIRYKDTTITRVNYENKTIARVRYDDQGNQQFECLSAEINEKFERISERIDKDIERRSKTENSFNPQYIFYAIGFLGLIILVGLGFVSFMFLKIQKQMPQMISSVVKEVIK